MENEHLINFYFNQFSNPDYIDYPVATLGNYKDRPIYDSNCVEFWLPVTSRVIPNITEGKYFVSTLGNTMNLITGEPLGLSMHRKGYYQFNFTTYNPETGGAGKVICRKLHRVIMLTFCYFPGCEKFQVNHIDGCKTNNALSNLEWCTGSENAIHAINNGLWKVFGNEYKSVITDEDIKNILALKGTMSSTKIWIALGLKDKGVPHGTVKRILGGQNRVAAFESKHDNYGI